MRSRCGRRAFRASPIRCVGERIMATGVPEFREVAWRACAFFCNFFYSAIAARSLSNFFTAAFCSSGLMSLGGVNSLPPCLQGNC
ncbi:hypothetical protein [Bathymodiolus japonicus methanotrophic gill symbiont]|uniref:hypothetical protein n=1 Tax=Bathymodiolus japonicus methanotrophic gill symbiont TaxID=113269 RepID=UPI001C8EF0F2|nr:hypothetical protein [Bathymodiolus japonicus methanotrophic gill symbiont]